MKRFLLIALMAGGLAFVPGQRSDAQVSVGIGGVGIGFGYPAYRYGYYNSIDIIGRTDIMAIPLALRTTGTMGTVTTATIGIITTTATK
jgi:hypothetical protein